MGLLEEIDKLNLSDEEKVILRREHESEVEPLRDSARREAAQAKLSRVEGKVTTLKEMGFADAPAALAFARRVWLSDDEEPAAVLMSDADLGLTGDQATGATGKQEITCSEVLDMFIEKLPKSQEGKLKIDLSDQALANEDDDRPDNGNEPTRAERTKQHREGLSKAIGKDIPERKRNRYRRGGIPVGGGES